MTQRTLELTIRLNDGNFEMDIYEPESGECLQMQFPFSPDEHPEFDEAIGNEIYSWLSLWADEESDVNEAIQSIERSDTDEDFLR